MNGILVIDKPQHFTSFDVIAVIRKISGQRKAGHTGTLDPNATGVLPVLLGSATKAQDLILNHNKTYKAGFCLGKTSNTLDVWGNVKEFEKPHINTKQIEDVLPDFTGEICQIPPMFSAVQQNGVRLYDLARKGIEVERKSRKVTVFSLNLLEFDEQLQCGVIELECSKGTYVRTLIDDMGKMLKTGAVMTSLRRTCACSFTINDCITLEKAKQLALEGTLENYVKPIESLFEDCKSICVSAAQARRFSNGGALDIERTVLNGAKLAGGEIFRIKNENNLFLGLGIIDENAKQIKIYLHVQ